MREKLLRLPNMQDALLRKSILKDCLNLDSICRELYTYKMSVKDNISKLLASTYVSWAWMIKVKILDQVDTLLTLNIFWNPKINWKIIENIHMHNFQAYSYVMKWVINEDYFLFNHPTDKQIHIYKNFLEMVSSLTNSDKVQLLEQLEWLLVKWSDFRPENSLKLFFDELWATMDELKGIYTIFSSVKLIGDKWAIIWERFTDNWICHIEHTWSRKIEAGNNYFLPDDQWHRIQVYQPTTTVFLADKTYKTRGFPKSNWAYIKRWHVKKLKNQQAAFESRWYDLYGISAQELYSIVLDEIDSILIKN